MNKILVTGGAGFIGSNLCARLVKDPNNYVICVDNFSTGNLCNIKPLIGLSNFDWYETDITVMNPISIDINEIYNAACPASPPAYQTDPVKTTLTCVLGTYNLLQAARKNNAKMVQFSTSEVYGNPLQHPQIETYFGNVNPIGIRSCYDEGKRCAESLCFDFIRKYNTDVRVIRIFNTYGPNMDKDDGRVISNFICQALQNKPLTLYGDGSQTRSFCYVDDLVDGIIKVMALKDNPKIPINLGNPGEFTLLELIKLIQQELGNTSIQYLPLPADDPVKRQPDITAAKTLLNWEPSIKLQDGLRRTIKYFKGVLEDENN